MSWHKKVLVKHAKEIFSSGVFYILLILVFLLWRFAFGYQFEWQNIEPFSPPSIFIRIFYSAFTFVTLGFLLYVLRFYKALHDILVRGMNLWGLYNSIKAIVWAVLMYLSYQYIVPWLFSILNASVSILYNIASFVLYIFPPLGIAIIIAISYTFFRKQHTRIRNPN
jgi:hypothetical protein